MLFDSADKSAHFSMAYKYYLRDLFEEVLVFLDGMYAGDNFENGGSQLGYLCWGVPTRLFVLGSGTSGSSKDSAPA